MPQQVTATSVLHWLDSILEISEQLPHQGDFTIQGLKLSIHAYDPETYHWIEKYLYPLPVETGEKANTNYSVNLFYSDELVQQVLRTIGNSEVDTSFVYNGRRELQRITVSEDITVDCDPEFGMLWVTNRAENIIILVLSIKVRWFLLEISRVVRDLATRYLADNDWVIFHAGAVRSDGKNHIVIGDSGAGKTSFIIAMLSAGAAYIANERVFVKVVDNQLQILSFPMPIAVGLGTMMQYPELINYLREPHYIQYPPRRMDSHWIHEHPESKWADLEDKPQFLAQDLSNNFSDVHGVSGGSINGLIVPDLQRGQVASLASLDATQSLKIIRNNWIDPDCDDIYPPWMPLDFQQPSIDKVNTTIIKLMELPSIKFTFSAAKNRRNETSLYPEFLERCFKI